MKNEFVILLDCGHALKTLGKRSPVRADGTRFFEYLSNRLIGRLVAKKLEALGIKYHFVLNLDTEEDTPLAKRVEMANAYARGYGKNNCLFISIHSNAFGNGKSFNSARGWCVYTSVGNTKSDEYATTFWNVANEIFTPKGLKLRKDMSDGDVDQEENFYVLKHTICPAVLFENFFFTNEDDLKYLDSDEGREDISNMIVEGIRRIIEKRN